MMRIKCCSQSLAKGFATGKSKKDRSHTQRIFGNLPGITGIVFRCGSCLYRRCISGSQLTIIASYRGVATVKSVPADSLVSNLSTLLN